MTHPFQSIVAKEADQDAHDEWQALMELRADDIRAEEQSAAAQASMKMNGQAANAASDDLFNVPEPGSLSQGGVYTPEDALARLNSRYFIGKSKQETAVFRLNADGSATFVPLEQLKLEVQNFFAQVYEFTYYCEVLNGHFQILCTIFMKLLPS